MSCWAAQKGPGKIWGRRMRAAMEKTSPWETTNAMRHRRGHETWGSTAAGCPEERHFLLLRLSEVARRCRNILFSIAPQKGLTYCVPEALLIKSFRNRPLIVECSEKASSLKNE